MDKRLNSVKEIIKNNQCDGYIVTCDSDIRYLSGLVSSNIMLLITKDKCTTAIIGIQFELHVNHCNQSRDLLAKIGAPALPAYKDNAAYPHDIFILIFLREH